MHLAARRFVAALLLLLGTKVQALVVLQYHHVSDSTPAATSTAPALFKQHLQYLNEKGFRVIDASEFEGLMRGTKPLPDKTVLITFDDGYRSVFDTAFPLLQKFSYPFVVFVNSEAHDEQHSHFMSWDELRTLSKSGATIANHTHSHAHLIRREADESDKAFALRRLDEIQQAQARIQQEIGAAPKLFAYPYGEYDSALKGLLKAEGYLAFGQQSGAVSLRSDFQLIPRFPFGGLYGAMGEFAVKVNSRAFPNLSVSLTGPSGEHLLDPALPQGIDSVRLSMTSPLLDSSITLNCFASGQGAIQVERIPAKQLAVVEANKSLPAGRSRYNCTAQSPEGWFYWYSHLFIRKDENGAWLHE